MRLAVAKLQPAGAALGLETKGSALGALLSVLVDFTAAAAAAVAAAAAAAAYSQSTLGCFVVSKYKIPRQVDLLYEQILEQTGDQLLLLWFGAAKRRVKCAVLGVEPKRPKPHWLPLARRVRSSRPVLSWYYFVF